MSQSYCFVKKIESHNISTYPLLEEKKAYPLEKHKKTQFVLNINITGATTVWRLSAVLYIQLYRSLTYFNSAGWIDTVCVFLVCLFLWCIYPSIHTQQLSSLNTSCEMWMLFIKRRWRGKECYQSFLMKVGSNVTFSAKWKWINFPRETDMSPTRWEE